MVEMNIVVTLTALGFDDYNNVSSGHFSATLPPKRFSAEYARRILNEQAIPFVLKCSVGYLTLTNLSMDARGYAFSILPRTSETREALTKLNVGENISVVIKVEAPDDFSAETAS